MGMAVLALWNNALVSASAAEVTTCFIALHSNKRGPMRGTVEDEEKD